MGKKTKEQSFEERMQRLQAIVNSLENGDKALEESVALYKEGLQHAGICREQLAKARHNIEVCADGLITPYDQNAVLEDTGGD